MKRNVRVHWKVGSFFVLYYIELSEQVCDERLRALCLYNSFGVITILQEEIISCLKYINSEDLPQELEIRVCNALTILRSIVSCKEYVSLIMDCSISDKLII